VTPASVVRFESHGVAIELTCDSAATLDAATPLLPPLRTPWPKGPVQGSFHLSSETRPDGKTVLALGCAGRDLCSSTSLREVLGALEWQLSLFIAQRAPDRIFVHAGAVEWRGRALLVPGRSFSGKSTLVAALVRAGCGYLSDEYAILDSRGSCHPHPRRLSLRVSGRVEKWSAEELGGRTRCEPLPVGCVVVTRYRDGALWRPAPLSPGEVVMALLENTVVARTRPREALAVLQASTAAAEALGGIRGDAADLVSALLSSRS
jgi:hypothetical protein